MDINTAAAVFAEGRSLGADFVEIFEEETRASALTLKDKVIESANASTDYGVGVRLLYGTEVLYAYTSDVSRENLVSLVRTLAFGRAGNPPAYANLAPLTWAGTLHHIQDPRVLGQGFKLDFLQRADSSARQVSSNIVQVTASIIDAVSHIEILNSEGLHIRDERSRVRFNTTVTAGKDGDRVSASEAPGFFGGYEVLAGLPVEDLARQAGERALRVLSAPYIGGGQMPVVMGNGFGGVIFHEACGHPLETESVRRKSSPFYGKIGEQIAHRAVTAIDDGTITGKWGSINVDDEGTPVQKTVLIENGILKTFMSDRVGAAEVGVPLSGSARRQSYKYAPVSRMRNTYIAAGTDSFDDMIASVPDGLYASKMGGGSVNPATGEFNFAVEEGYRIKDGKLAGVVRGATLIGKGDQVLPRISMVGSDLTMAAGMCGASSGMMPVTVGQPHIKVDKILVGGRA